MDLIFMNKQIRGYSMLPWFMAMAKEKQKQVLTEVLEELKEGGSLK